MSHGVAGSICVGRRSTAWVISMLSIARGYTGLIARSFAYAVYRTMENIERTVRPKSPVLSLGVASRR